MRDSPRIFQVLAPVEVVAQQILVLEVAGLPLLRRWSVVHRRDKKLTYAATSFIEFLQTERQQLVNDSMPVGGSRRGRRD